MQYFEISDQSDPMCSSTVFG